MPFDTYAARIEGIGEIISSKRSRQPITGPAHRPPQWQISDALHTHLLDWQGWR